MAVFIHLSLFLRKRPSQWLNCVWWPVALVKRIGLKSPYGEVVRAHCCISPSLKMASLGSQWQEYPRRECMNTLHPEGPPEWLRWSPLTLIGLFFFFQPLNKNSIFLGLWCKRHTSQELVGGISQRLWGRKPLNRLQIKPLHLNAKTASQQASIWKVRFTLWHRLLHSVPLLWPTLLWVFIHSSWCVCNASPQSALCWHKTSRTSHRRSIALTQKYNTGLSVFTFCAFVFKVTSELRRRTALPEPAASCNNLSGE